MNNQKQLLVLYSSDYRRLYKKDIFNVIAYPSGLIMHFRYRLKWISEEIISNLPPKGLQVLINAAVAIDREKKLFKIVPLRKAELILALIDGNAIHVYFKLLPEWVLYNDSSGKTINFYDTFFKQGECPSKGKFIAFCDPGEISFSSDSNAWVSIIQALVKFENFKNSLFYRINNIIKSKNNKLLDIEDFDDLTSGYILKRGVNYLIDCSFDFGQDPPEKSENAKFKFESTDNLKIIPNDLILGFRVDKKQFYLTTSGKSFNVRTLIRSRIENSIEGPELEIPIKIKRNKFIYFAYLTLIFAGLILLGWPWDLDWLGTSMRILGTSLTTIGTFLINYYEKW